MLTVHSYYNKYPPFLRGGYYICGVKEVQLQYNTNKNPAFTQGFHRLASIHSVTGCTFIIPLG